MFKSKKQKAIEEQRRLDNYFEAEAVKHLDLLGNTKHLKPEEKEMFIHQCKMHHLNPFKREIYINAYGEGRYRTLSIVTGYEVYLRRAKKSGLLVDWSVKVVNYDPKNLDTMYAEVEIIAKDKPTPFVWQSFYRESVQKKKDGSINKFWKEMPTLMLRKTCISQAFRLCFPLMFDGFLYAAEEISDIDDQAVRDVTPDTSELKPEGVYKETSKPTPSQVPELPTEPAQGVDSEITIAMLSGLANSISNADKINVMRQLPKAKNDPELRKKLYKELQELQ